VVFTRPEFIIALLGVKKRAVEIIKIIAGHDRIVS
jgi:hypothetical protein